MEDLDFEFAKSRNMSLKAARPPGEKFERKSWAGMGPRKYGRISLATSDGLGPGSDIMKLMVILRAWKVVPSS